MDRIPISLEQMGRIARYEETFERYADRLKDGETEYTFEPEAYYRVTLDDLYTALKNIKEKDPYCYVLAGLSTTARNRPQPSLQGSAEQNHLLQSTR